MYMTILCRSGGRLSVRPQNYFQRTSGYLCDSLLHHIEGIQLSKRDYFHIYFILLS